MKTTQTQSGGFVTTVTKADRARFQRIIERLAHETVIEPIGGYAKQDMWPRIVSQVCVMGASRGMAALRKDKESGAAFDRAMSLRQLSKKAYRVNSIAKPSRTSRAEISEPVSPTSWPDCACATSSSESWRPISVFDTRDALSSRQSARGTRARPCGACLGLPA